MPAKSLPAARAKSRKFDYGIALELALKGWATQDIADKLKVTYPSVAAALRRYAPLLEQLQPGCLEAYRQQRTNLFTAVERELMTSLTDPAKMAKASLNNVAYAFQQVHTARRLEENRSTNNTAVLTRMIDSAYDTLHIDSPGKLRTKKATIAGSSNDNNELAHNES